ncbi:hypothetical protein GF324_05305 [bacterium]|nr:hypothetical protein [bacterium]
MDIKWVDKLARIYGVNGALLVDKDGLIIADAGDTSEQVAPHSALMVKKLISRIGLQAFEEWEWTQCESEGMVIAIANMDIGILVLVMDADANLGLVRIEARRIRRTLREEFKRM